MKSYLTATFFILSVLPYTGKSLPEPDLQSFDEIQPDLEEEENLDKKNLLAGNKGKYTTKEEIQRPPSEDHPCRLTRTTIEISFPDMKSELFVDLLGYKEPNLISLMRCKGVCGYGATNITHNGDTHQMAASTSTLTGHQAIPVLGNDNVAVDHGPKEVFEVRGFDDDYDNDEVVLSSPLFGRGTSYDGRMSPDNVNKDDEIDCIPIQVKQKRVNMMVRTKLSGRDPREKNKDIVLEEHLECGCRCRHGSAQACPGRFDPTTCQCHCVGEELEAARQRCLLANRLAGGAGGDQQGSGAAWWWDGATCQCRSKTVAARGVDSQVMGGSSMPNGLSSGGHADCGGYDSQLSMYGVEEVGPTYLEIVSLVLLGSFLTISLFFAASTFYYRRKVVRILNKNKAEVGPSGDINAKINLGSNKFNYHQDKNKLSSTIKDHSKQRPYYQRMSSQAELVMVEEKNSLRRSAAATNNGHIPHKERTSSKGTDRDRDRSGRRKDDEPVNRSDSCHSNFTGGILRNGGFSSWGVGGHGSGGSNKRKKQPQQTSSLDRRLIDDDSGGEVLSSSAHNGGQQHGGRSGRHHQSSGKQTYGSLRLAGSSSQKSGQYTSSEKVMSSSTDAAMMPTGQLEADNGMAAVMAQQILLKELASFDLANETTGMFDRYDEHGVKIEDDDMDDNFMGNDGFSYIHSNY